MRIKQTAFFFCLMCLMQMLPLPVRAQEPETAYLLMEANTGCILDACLAEEIRPVGSLAKLMTAYLTAKAIENQELSLDTSVTAGESVSGMKGAVIWLKSGDSITIRELLLGLIAGNANDAAAVLADKISGNAENFVMDMNAAAFDLGMKSTRFTTPQGFDDSQAYSTAHDMALLCGAVLQCPVLKESLTTWRTFILNDTVELVNENTFTRTMKTCCGLKASHSPESGYCLASASESDGMMCIAVVLGAPDEDSRFTLAKKLLHSGFSQYQITLPAFAEEFLRPMKIRNGTESAVLLELSSLPALAVPSGTQLSAVIVLPEFVQAPVKYHQKVGKVYFYQGKSLLCECALLTSEAVPEMTMQSAWKE
ncbi:MAG: D-alanyl-D-alanine carboxypeptidase, partial [Oscillospiraceae bacterium]|nr:D-alanyl-D-alanine carboxypeptidase [Oscillospiraceae bacterium]